jgi:hypothetical protein
MFRTLHKNSITLHVASLPNFTTLHIALLPNFTTLHIALLPNFTTLHGKRGLPQNFTCKVVKNRCKVVKNAKKLVINGARKLLILNELVKLVKKSKV